MCDDGDLIFWRALADGMAGWAVAQRGDNRGLLAIEHAVQVATRAMPVWQSLLHLLMADCLNALGQAEHALESVERARSEEHTSELQSLMRISYAVFCLKKKTKTLTRIPYNTKENTS